MSRPLGNNSGPGISFKGKSEKLESSLPHQSTLIREICQEEIRMKIKQELSNYEKKKNEMAEVFLQYDQEKMIQKFELEFDEHYLYLCFFSRKYGIDRQNGQVVWWNENLQTEEKAGYNEAMTIYDVLCYSREYCHLAHEWVNVGSLSSVKGGTLAKSGDFFQNAAKAFEGKAESLARACEGLHGRKIEKGDVAYELDMFPFLPISLRFWDADEEFPASMQLLVDRNILDYMHYETLMFALSYLLERLSSEIGSSGFRHE